MVRTKAKTTWAHKWVKNHKFSLISPVFQLLELTSLTMRSSYWDSQKQVVQEWFGRRSTTSLLFPDAQGGPLSTTSHFQVKGSLQPNQGNRAAGPEFAKQVRATTCLWGQLGELSEADRDWQVKGMVGVRGRELPHHSAWVGL